MVFAAKAQALSVKHHLNATIGPFNASTAEFEYRLGNNDYAIQSTIRTNGLFDTLYPFEATYSTTGRIKNQNMETTSYKYKSKSRFSRRTKEMIYNEKGEPVYSVSTKNKKEKIKDIIPTPNNQDTTDLQTVIAEIAKKYNDVHFCESKMQIFDGKRRFDVIVEDEGKEQLTESKDFPFSGMAAKCSMFIDKLGSKGDDLLWQLTSDKRIYFWIMQEEKTSAPFIARVYIKDTPLGEMNVYTSKIEVKE